MARALTIPRQLSVREWEARYRRARDPVARSHWQIIWLLADGIRTAEVARVTGYSGTWIREIARRYREDGPAGLGDRRHANPGGAPLLTPAQQAELQAVLAEPPPDGGVWTCRKVAAWIGAAVGRPVAEARGWEGMRRLGFPPQQPRPRATRADPEAQAAFTKGGSTPPSTPSPSPIRPRT